uniref:Uncharacterized protein n=1 Tax=virus sp. ctah610 TaxID=2826807 RepID=A0A8S5R7K4_9VIRU|nr:MAG TPA: hypothetical protein [virus sp. ctah610]
MPLHSVGMKSWNKYAGKENACEKGASSSKYRTRH